MAAAGWCVRARCCVWLPRVNRTSGHGDMIMRILVVDDHELFRQGLKWLLASLNNDLQFVEADSLETLVRVVEQDDDDFDIVLLDLFLPDSDGLQGLYLMQEMLPDASTVILSSNDDPTLVVAAIQNGAAGFIPKSSSRQVLVAALRLVLAGGVYIPPHALPAADEVVRPAVADSHVNGHPQPNAAAVRLTGRQRDVLRLAVQGKVNKVIARELKISEATVKAHLSASFRALGVKNRTEATFKVADMDLFSQPD